MAAARSGGGEGFSSHREGQRPQRLQETAQDENQCPCALHQDRSERTSTQIYFRISEMLCYYIQCHKFHLVSVKGGGGDSSPVRQSE